MAIRQIRVQGDEVLEKVCRPVKGDYTKNSNID